VKMGLAVLCDWSPWSFINAHALVVIYIIGDGAGQNCRPSSHSIS
jgi:hypothetical protein